MAKLKSVLLEAPVLGDAIVKIRPPQRRRAFPGSRDYWRERYEKGGNSGAGSYSRLAEFKAEVLNGFVKGRSVRSVIEFGCGDGNQLGLAEYPHYLGVDVAERAITLCRDRFAGDRSKEFKTLNELGPEGRAELALSLDVIYHLVEDEVFDKYMRTLFASAERFVIVYSSDKNESTPAAHVRHRKFTDWVSTHAPQWKFIERIGNRFPYAPENPLQTSFADFYIFELR